ncbi:LysR family transcriptional regulator [Acuticoccus sp.]|uniref:LysR family transcriptional regulator n=1 Tax=Acuticoccus sp. TaxID=1904378 RepID=UPI003B521B6C
MARANIRQIEAFNAVMKSGSVTGAAVTLFLGQPAVTQLLKAVDDACGFALFERRSGRSWATRGAPALRETESLEVLAEPVVTTIWV